MTIHQALLAVINFCQARMTRFFLSILFSCQIENTFDDALAGVPSLFSCPTFCGRSGKPENLVHRAIESVHFLYQDFHKFMLGMILRKIIQEDLGGSLYGTQRVLYLVSKRS